MSEQWPPASGLPPKSHMIPGKKLEWGQTPFDNLSRAELLRLVQAYHSALTSARSIMLMQAQAQEDHPYWGPQGSGGRALIKANHLMKLAGADGMDAASEKIYRSFFRYCDTLFFPVTEDFGRWGVNDNDKSMTAPFRAEDGYRPLEWRDLLPEH